jgi:hypothetical protein
MTIENGYWNRAPPTISLASYEFLRSPKFERCLVEFCASECASLPVTEGRIVGKASVRMQRQLQCAYCAFQDFMCSLKSQN